MSAPQDTRREPQPLARPATSRWLWRIFGMALGLTVVAEWFIEPRDDFGLANTFGFNAWYGVLACVVIAGIAKLLGFVVKRPESYYGDRDV